MGSDSDYVFTYAVKLKTINWKISLSCLLRMITQLLNYPLISIGLMINSQMWILTRCKYPYKAAISNWHMAKIPVNCKPNKWQESKFTLSLEKVMLKTCDGNAAFSMYSCLNIVPDQDMMLCRHQIIFFSFEHGQRDPLCQEHNVPVMHIHYSHAIYKSTARII